METVLGIQHTHMACIYMQTTILHTCTQLYYTHAHTCVTIKCTCGYLFALKMFSTQGRIPWAYSGVADKEGLAVIYAIMTNIHGSCM